MITVMKVYITKILFKQFHSRCFLFVTGIISLLVTTLAIYLLYKHRKLRMQITSFALQQIKEVGTVTMQDNIITACTCKIQFYIILALSISILA